MDKPNNKVCMVLISLIVLFLTHSVVASQTTQSRPIDVEVARQDKSVQLYMDEPGVQEQGQILDALGLERLAAHWSLNEADYDGNYLDTVDGYMAQPTGEPNFIDGVRDEPNGAVMVTQSTGWGLSGAVGVDLTGGFTICLWVNWNGDWQEPIGIGDLAMESKEAEYVLSNGIKADQRWQQVCVTYENSMVRVYLDGRLRLSEMWELPTGYEAAVEIGNSRGQQIFNGAIDDIRLYNYALSQMEITQLVTGNANCTQEYSLEYDFSGSHGLPDCVVNFYDLAEFSERWLASCILPYALEWDASGPYGVPDCVVNMYDLAEFCDSWLSCGIYPSCP